MGIRRRTRIAAICAAAGLTLAACGTGAALPGNAGTKAGHTSPTPATADASSQAFPHRAGSSVVSLEAAHSYTPHAPHGGTDDYHCTLVDPHLKQNSYIVASHFFPNSPEVHHAILFEVPPAAVAEAKTADAGGKGWTCFGETTLPGQGLGSLGATPWLAAWAPGHGLDQTPKNTGVYFPKGSMVIMQIHYNLLVGDKPVLAKLMLQTVPATTHLQPLHLDLLPAPPDIPCPSGVHGPLCNRAASLKDLGQRFGPDLVGFVNLIEQVCGRNPSDPPAGDSTSCTWPVSFSGKILRLTPHMHLLGVSMRFILNPGTPQQKMLLNVKHYDFDYQRSYNITPTVVHPGDKLEVSCTYNPRLRQQLPQLRTLPPRYVTWGDGSSDEMCLGIVSWIAS